MVENEIYLSRIELCVRSGYSKNKGVGSVEDVVRTAKQLNIKALALCDDYSTNGFKRFNNCCKKNNIIPIYGTTINIDDKRVILIAKNVTGITSINKIISISKNNNNSISDLGNISDSVITIGILENEKDYVCLLETFDYIGVKLVGNKKYDFLDRDSDRIIAISDSYYPEEVDKVLFDSLSNSISDDYYSRKIQSCEKLLNTFSPKFVYDNPKYLLNSISLFEYNPSSLCFSNLISVNEFDSLVLKKFKLCKINKECKYINRLKEELNHVHIHHYESIYYLMYKISELAKNRGNIISIRGLASNSLICYILGITYVDPLFYSLPFESFLRDDEQPSFVINIPNDFRNDVENLLENLVGIDNVAKQSSNTYYSNYDIFKIVNDTISHKYIPNLEDVKIFKLKNTVSEKHPHYGYAIKNNSDDFNCITALLPNIDSKFPLCETTNDCINGYVSKFELLETNHLSLIKDLMLSTNVDFDSIDLNNIMLLDFLFGSNQNKILNITEDNQLNPFIGLPDFQTDYFYDLFNKCKPINYYDLIKIMGFLHGTNVWNHNQDKLFDEGYPLKDLIADREDIYNILIDEYHLEKNLSFSIMENVRKGRGIKEKDISVLKQNKIPQYLIDTMQTIKYAFPKGHIINYLYISVKLAFYKINFPEQFYFYVLKHYYGSLLSYLKETNESSLTSYFNSSIHELNSKLHLYSGEEKEIIKLLIEAKLRNIHVDINSLLLECDRYEEI